MTTPGILPIASLPGWPQPIAGVMAGLAAITPCFVSPDGLHVGDTVAAQNFLSAYAGSASELTFNQAQQQTALATLFGSKFIAGFKYTVPGDASGSHNYQIDPASVANIVGAGAWASSAVAGLPGVAAWPTGFTWIDASNNAVPMTAAQCAGFASAVGAYITALILNNRALKTAVASAASMTALAAIDITQGWSSN
jgi:hypothetical protein